MAKKRLGRGLNALIPEMPETVDNGVKEIDISAITPNRNQPRQDFDQQKLEELAGSIAQHGIVQPILLRRLSRGYEIVAGERRWRAARLAGLKAVPAIVKELDDRQVMEMALIENLQREDLNPLEEAEAYKRLSEEFGLTQEDISNAVGKSRPAIANTLRLLGLPEQIQGFIRDNRISAGHARAIIPLDEKQQLQVVGRILENSLNVRETEKLVNRILNQKKAHKQRTSQRQPWIAEVEGWLAEHLGTKVHIIQGKRKGKLEIEYYGAEDLERILDIIKK